MESLIGMVLERFLGDYFSNFSRDKFSLSLMKGTISMNDLIVNKSINDRINFPVKLKYGQLGHLQIKTNSYLNLGTKGLECKISGLFFCFEMLEMKQWSKQTILEKYKEMHRHVIAVLEK